MDQDGVIPLYQGIRLQVQKDNAKGLQYSPTGAGFNFRGTYLK